MSTIPINRGGLPTLDPTIGPSSFGVPTNRALDVYRKHIIDNTYDTVNPLEIYSGLLLIKQNIASLSLIKSKNFAEGYSYSLKHNDITVIFDTDLGYKKWELFKIDKDSFRVLNLFVDPNKLQNINNIFCPTLPIIDENNLDYTQYVQKESKIQILTSSGKVVPLYDVYVQANNSLTDGTCGDIYVVIPTALLKKISCFDRVLTATIYGKKRAFEYSNFITTTKYKITNNSNNLSADRICSKSDIVLINGKYIHPNEMIVTLSTEVDDYVQIYKTLSFGDADVTPCDIIITSEDRSWVWDDTEIWNDNNIWEDRTIWRRDPNDRNLGIENIFKYDDESYYILHIPKEINPSNKIIHLTSCDIFVVPKLEKTEVYDPGICINEDLLKYGRQITHNDFAIPTRLILKYMAAFGTKAIKIVIYPYTNVAYGNILDSVNLIPKLYELETTDGGIVARLVKTKTNNDYWFWSAESLIENKYIEFLKQPNINRWYYVSLEDFVKAFGYFKSMAVLSQRIFNSTGQAHSDLVNISIDIPPFYDNKKLECVIQELNDIPKVCTIIDSSVDDTNHKLNINVDGFAPDTVYQVEIFENSPSCCTMVPAGIDRCIIRKHCNYTLFKLTQSPTTDKYIWNVVDPSLYITHVKINDVAYIQFNEEHNDIFFAISFGSGYVNISTTVSEAVDGVVLEEGVADYLADGINIKELYREAQSDSIFGTFSILPPNYRSPWPTVTTLENDEFVTVPLSKYNEGIVDYCTDIVITPSVVNDTCEYDLELSQNNIWINENLIVAISCDKTKIAIVDINTLLPTVEYSFDGSLINSIVFRQLDNVIFCTENTSIIHALKISDDLLTITHLAKKVLDIVPAESVKQNITLVGDTKYILVDGNVINPIGGVGYVLSFKFCIDDADYTCVFNYIDVIKPMVTSVSDIWSNNRVFYEDVLWRNAHPLINPALPQQSFMYDASTKEIFVKSYNDSGKLILGHLNLTTFTVEHITVFDGIDDVNNIDYGVVLCDNNIILNYINTGSLYRIGWNIANGFYYINEQSFTADIGERLNIPSKNVLVGNVDNYNGTSVCSVWKLTNNTYTFFNTLQIPTSVINPHYVKHEYNSNIIIYRTSDVQVNNTVSLTKGIVNYNIPDSLFNSKDAHVVLSKYIPHPVCFFNASVEVPVDNFLYMSLNESMLNSNNINYMLCGIRFSYAYKQYFNYNDRTGILSQDKNITSLVLPNDVLKDSQGYNHIKKYIYDLYKFNRVTINNVVTDIDWDHSYDDSIFIPLTITS